VFGLDTGWLAQILGVSTVKFSAAMTGGGSGSAGSIGLAEAAIKAAQAETIVSLGVMQESGPHRTGATYAKATEPLFDFSSPYGCLAPAHFFSLMITRHMYLYGTSREHFAEVCISQRANAANRDTARFRMPLTMNDYFQARMISDPLCLLDCTMESDGAVAIITTTSARAKGLRQHPVSVLASAQGGDGRWGRGYVGQNMPDDLFATAGSEAIAKLLFERAGVKPTDIDVALLYDHFSPMVLLQLEDYGFCERGESGPFVAEGNIRFGTGSIPVNTHGGHLSEAFVAGMTHIREAVEQLRHSAVNQVADAELALVSGGPSLVPVSALILKR
jgi:acetyl-CoA acetyltransferase